MSEEDPKYSELGPDTLPGVNDYIRARWSQLSTTTSEVRKEAIKFIGLINAGGAATVLAFMSGLLTERRDIAQHDLLKAALILFVAAIIFSALAHIIQYAYIDGLFVRWRRDVKRFHNDQLGFSEMLEKDIQRGDEHDPTNFCLGMAVSGFVLGATLGGLLILGVK